MDLEKAEKWLRENQDRIGLEFQEIHSAGSGESNHNFVIEGDERLVLRVTKEISRKSRLENEAEKLEFLENEGIEGVPRKFFFEKDTEIGEVLIQTFVGEEKLDKDNLNEERIRSMARKIAEIHSIPVENYREFSNTQVQERRSLKDIFEEDYRKWSKRPFEEYRELAETINEQVEYYFSKQKNLLNEITDKQVEQSLCHGDLGFNIRATGNEVFIIDWEFSRINHPGIEIIYCFEHEELEKSQRSIFLDEYRKIRETDDVFDFLREIYPKFLAFNDLVWAAKRVEEGDDKEELMEKRLNELQRYYSDYNERKND